jgi:hypothetical protein
MILAGSLTCVLAGARETRGSRQRVGDSPKKRGQKAGHSRVTKKVAAGSRVTRGSAPKMPAGSGVTKKAASKPQPPPPPPPPPPPAPPTGATVRKSRVSHDTGSKGRPVFVDELPDDVTAPPEGA